jgi:AbrB family looped-hinge helix DNA binding protein
MSTVATTKLSSKGQVVIPEIIREQLHLKTGDQFVVLGDKDVVILKNISPPAIDEFDGLIAEARKSAKIAGLKKMILKLPFKKSALTDENCAGYKCIDIWHFLLRATLADSQVMERWKY